jgi:hypothetical protein
VARRFNVPESTLYTRLRGTKNRAKTRVNSYKLTEIEEGSLLKWILLMDSRGGAPRHLTIREIANLLLVSRGSTLVFSVGKNWVIEFVKRYSDLLSRFSRRYNYKRAKYEDPKIISE